MKHYKTNLLDLKCCDNMQLMSQYADNHFDLAVVDPPYGINAGKMNMGKGSRNETNKNIKKDWDSHIPSVDYFKELFRVSKNQIIWGGNYFIDYLTATRCFLLWDKKDYNSDFASHELAWTSFQKNTKCFIRARNVGDEQKIHPTQKPVKLYDWIFQNYANDGDKILDTHLGSGSIAIASHYAGLHLTACEIDEDYFKESVSRIKRETAQQSLF